MAELACDVMLPVGPDPFDDVGFVDALATLIGPPAAVWLRDLPLVDANDGDHGSGLAPFPHAMWLLERLRCGVGFGAISLPYRDPVTTARSVWTLARLHPGRALIGVGLGHKEPVNEHYAVSGREERAALFAQRYRAVRALTVGDVESRLADDLREGSARWDPPALATPPTFALATSDPGVWEAVECRAEALLTWFDKPQRIEGKRQRIAALRGADIDVCMHVNWTVTGGRRLELVQEPLLGVRGGPSAFRSFVDRMTAEGVQRVIAQMTDVRDPAHLRDIAAELGSEVVDASG